MIKISTYLKKPKKDSKTISWPQPNGLDEVSENDAKARLIDILSERVKAPFLHAIASDHFLIEIGVDKSQKFYLFEGIHKEMYKLLLVINWYATATGMYQKELRDSLHSVL